MDNHKAVYQTTPRGHFRRISSVLNEFIGLLGSPYPTIIPYNTTKNMNCTVKAFVTVSVIVHMPFAYLQA